MKPLEQIEERNRRVELDKAWETSWTRKMSIDATDPWLSALVPTEGYLLSTLTLTPLKQYWLKSKQP